MDYVLLHNILQQRAMVFKMAAVRHFGSLKFECFNIAGDG